MHKILLIEDELNVASLIKKGMEEEGFEVHHTIDGVKGIEYLQSSQVDLILLDILLPVMNGLEVCRKIKEGEFSKTPILMLTALSSAENVALGLDSGADDYLAKPFKLIELKARVRNLLRRNESKNSNPNQNEEIYTFSDIKLDDNSKQVWRDGKEISLTSTEFRLLLMFLKNPKKVLSRTSLLEEVWGIDFDIGTNVVDVYVNYLRKKLDAAGDKKLIHTVIGMGYVLKENE